jgi:hypothetical protein
MKNMSGTKIIRAKTERPDAAVRGVMVFTVMLMKT